MCVQAGIAFFDKKHLIDEAIKFPLTLSENGKLAVLCSHGLPRNVFQSPSSCVLQCAGGGVGLYSRHNLHRTDHMKKNTQHIVD